MEYQKVINLQSSKLRTRNWIETEDESWGTYNASNEIIVKTSVIRSNLYDYSDPYIHVKGTIAVPNTGTAAVPNSRNRKVIFKNCTPFTNCISEINNTQVDDAHDIDVVMPVYILIEYNNIYSKTSRSLWQCFRDKPTLGDNIDIIDFPWWQQ